MPLHPLVTIGVPNTGTKFSCERICHTQILVIDPAQPAYAAVCEGIKANGGSSSGGTGFAVITPEAWSAIKEVLYTLAPTLLAEDCKVPLIKTLLLVSELTGNRLALKQAKSLTDIYREAGCFTKESIARLTLTTEAVVVEVWS